MEKSSVEKPVVAENVKKAPKATKAKVKKKPKIKSSGAGSLRIMLSEILPNLSSTVIVFFPLMVALNMLTEAALSFLSIGVQPPNASWGTIILDGQELLYTRPVVAIAPGIAIAVTVLALNVLGDGVRDAFDPRAKIHLEH